MMLVLRRKVGEVVHIGDDIEIEITEVGHGHIKLGITAPPEIPVHRREIYDEIHGITREETNTN